MFKKKKHEPGRQAASRGQPAPAKLGDEELGRAMFKVYHDAMSEIVSITAARADVAEIRQSVIDVKEGAIKDLVDMGKARASRDTQQRARADLVLVNAISRIDATLFKSFQDAIMFYRGKDAVFATLLSSFNIITQYADFDLLKKQSPDEAKRLGIE